MTFKYKGYKLLSTTISGNITFMSTSWDLLEIRDLLENKLQTTKMTRETLTLETLTNEKH